MIGYALVGTNQLEKALAFYDALLGPLGAGSAMEHPNGGRVYAVSPDKPMFGVVQPYDGKPATIGNGTMISLLLDTREQVEEVHARALSLGGADEGAPGWRGPEGGFFGGYFRDLDGNKICVYRFGA